MILVLESLIVLISMLHGKRGELKVYTVRCINEKGQSFDKKFSSPYLMRKFINKCKYSKKIEVVGWKQD